MADRAARPPLTIRRLYRLIGTETVAGQKRYVWEGPRLAGDSRAEQITCGVDWFWERGRS